MRQSETTLDRFYQSQIGTLSADLISQRILDLWGNCADLRLLGLGYATPLLKHWQSHARTCIAALPAPWQAARMDQAGGQALCRIAESRLPFREAVFDRILFLHALEEADNPRHLLREAWRVLAPEGRMLVITTNRKSLWSLDESKPYGHGRPWTRRQLSRFLNDCLFDVSASTTAVHMPPLNWPLITAAANAWERAGEALLPGLGGVVMVEAVKHLHAKPNGSATSPVLRAAKSGINRPALPRNRQFLEKTRASSRSEPLTKKPD